MGYSTQDYIKWLTTGYYSPHHGRPLTLSSAYQYGTSLRAMFAAVGAMPAGLMRLTPFPFLPGAPGDMAPWPSPEQLEAVMASDDANAVNARLRRPAMIAFLCFCDAHEMLPYEHARWLSQMQQHIQRDLRVLTAVLMDFLQMLCYEGRRDGNEYVRVMNGINEAAFMRKLTWPRIDVRGTSVSFGDHPHRDAPKLASALNTWKVVQRARHMHPPTYVFTTDNGRRLSQAECEHLISSRRQEDVTGYVPQKPWLAEQAKRFAGQRYVPYGGGDCAASPHCVASDPEAALPLRLQAAAAFFGFSADDAVDAWLALESA